MNKSKFIIVFFSLILLFSFPCFAAQKCPDCGSRDTGLEKVSPTCQDYGYREYECYECGYYDYDYYPIVDHDYVEYSREEPTYTSTGLQFLKCSWCGKGDTVIIPMLVCSDHQYIETDRIEPTYTSDGLQYLNCSICGKVETEIIPMLVCPDHHYIETDRVEPTENYSGAITYQCTICGDSYYSELDYVNPVPPDTSSLAKTVFNGVWGLTDIYVPGFNFTIRQMWLGVVICSISVMIIKHLFNLGCSGVSSRTGSTNKPKISDERKRDEY